jgi:hypothetical protein
MDESTGDGLKCRNRWRQHGATQSRAPAHRLMLSLSLALAANDGTPVVDPGRTEVGSFSQATALKSKK